MSAEFCPPREVPQWSSMKPLARRARGRASTRRAVGNREQHRHGELAARRARGLALASRCRGFDEAWDATRGARNGANYGCAAARALWMDLARGCASTLHGAWLGSPKSMGSRLPDSTMSLQPGRHLCNRLCSRAPSANRGDSGGVSRDQQSSRRVEVDFPSEKHVLYYLFDRSGVHKVRQHASKRHTHSGQTLHDGRHRAPCVCLLHRKRDTPAVLGRPDGRNARFLAARWKRRARRQV